MPNETLRSYDATATANNTPSGATAVGGNLDNHLRSIKTNVAKAARWDVTSTVSAAATISESLLHKVQPVDTNSAGASVTITLPTVGSAGAGWCAILKNTTGVAPLVVDGSDGNIDGASALTLTATNAAVLVVCDGSNYFALSDERRIRAPTETMELITSGAVTTAASLDITGLSDTYRTYKIVLDDWIPATDGVFLQMRTSIDNGSSFEAGAAAYEYASTGVVATGSSVGAFGSNGTTAVLMAQSQGNTEPLSGVLWIHYPTNSGGRTRVTFSVGYVNSVGNYETDTGSGGRTADEDNDAIRLMYSSGNITQGNYAIYGLRIA